MNQPNSQALPDISQMSALKDEVIKQYFNATQSLLPSIREQLHELMESLLSTDRLLSDSVLSALVLVGNHKWDGVAVSLEETRLSSNLNDEQREALSRSQREVLEQDALRDLQRLREKGQAVADALAGLGKVRLPGVAERMAMLDEQERALTLSVDRLKQQIDESEAQLAALAEVIHAFEAPDLQTILKRMIPTEAELQLVQQALLKAGADPLLLVSAAKVFVEKLAGIVEGRRLVDVINVRNRKVIDHGRLLDDLCFAEARRNTLVRELGQLPQVTALGDRRDQWLTLAAELSRGWSAQIQAIEQETELRNMADALSAMEKYLLAVRRLYEAV